jgi:hypothetical protein
MEMNGSYVNWNELRVKHADGEDVPLVSRVTVDQYGIPSRLAEHGNCDYHLCRMNESVATGDSKFFGLVVALAGDLEQSLARFIEDSDFVFACFAWLTNYRVLDALASVEHGCQVVVQKEDFLRPDAGHARSSNATLRRKYSALKCPFGRMLLPFYACDLSVCSDPRVEAVRCAGVANTDRRAASPRMHHKFAVSCRVSFSRCDVTGEDYPIFCPKSVWTGSFNPTANGTRSRENAVIIEDEAVGNFYLNEWSKVFAMSEPLNWRSKWVCPEWRIGT